MIYGHNARTFFTCSLLLQMKTKFKWTDRHRGAFDKMKSVIASNALMLYLDHTKLCKIDTNASDYRLGARIMWECKDVIYFSGTLTPRWKKYSTCNHINTPQVLIHASWRQNLCFADHKHQLSRTSTALEYLIGASFLKILIVKDNVRGNAFSQLPQTGDADPSNKQTSARLIEDSLYFSLTDFEEMLDCFLDLSAPQQMRYPIDLQWIQENRFDDRGLNNARH